MASRHSYAAHDFWAIDERDPHGAFPGPRKADFFDTSAPIYVAFSDSRVTSALALGRLAADQRGPLWQQEKFYFRPVDSRDPLYENEFVGTNHLFWVLKPRAPVPFAWELGDTVTLFSNETQALVRQYRVEQVHERRGRSTAYVDFDAL